ncbi:hypothetical protein [Hydrocarboniphaga effusa]|uniref:hypothetical protein n=1 Tax=Hydrocarboniphaga effusa TaxID=243629 RepID=UPI00398C0A5E
MALFKKSAADRAAELQKLRADIAAETERLAPLEAERKAALLNGDDKTLNELEAKITVAQNTIARMREREPILEAAREQAAVDEAEIAKQAEIAQAELVRQAAEAHMKKYPQLAQEIAQILSEVAAAEAYIQRVNKKHEARVAAPGQSFRYDAGDHHEETVARWYWPDGNPASKELQSSEGRAPDKPKARQVIYGFGRDAEIRTDEPQLKTRTVRVTDRDSRRLDPLGSLVSLPRFAIDESDLWNADIYAAKRRDDAAVIDALLSGKKAKAA